MILRFNTILTVTFLFLVVLLQVTVADEQPSSAEALLKTLDPFYKQHVVVDGLLIAGSEKVSKHALHETAYLAKKMLANRPDVMKHIVEKRKMYVCVIASSEMQTDLPECRQMGLWWAYRARGLGCRPVSCGEENLLSLKSIFLNVLSLSISRSAGTSGLMCRLLNGLDTSIRKDLEGRCAFRYTGYLRAVMTNGRNNP